MDTPVYLFTGFLESGKTKFIQDTLADPNFFEDRDSTVLVILCEEGEEEYDPEAFASSVLVKKEIDTAAVERALSKATADFGDYGER